MRRRILGCALLIVLGGCELEEIGQPNGTEVVLVQAIMRPDRSQQWVLVERSLTGAEPRQSTPGDIPVDRPHLPLTGATVTVRNRSLPGDPCGSAVLFTSDPDDPRLFESDGLYWAPPGCPTMRAGDTLDLRVETPGGVVVTGATEIAGASGFHVRIGGDTVDLPAPVMDFNRDLDTLTAWVDPIAGRALHLDFRRMTLATQIDGSTLRVTSVFVDSTAVRLPGTTIDVFSRGTGDDVFRAGRTYLFSVALADRNYFDFARSANGPITGRGFINHLEGGVGVFGSLEADSGSIRIIAERDDQREGLYRLRGDVDDVTVDIEMDLYLVRSVRDSVGASAFVTGTWISGQIDVSADGFFLGEDFEMVFQQARIDPFFGEVQGIDTYVLRGSVRPSSFTVVVVQNPFTLGTLRATR